MLKIVGTEPGSIAEELGIIAGDMLVSINEKPVTDRLDYRFYQADEKLEVCVQSGTEQIIFEIEKEADEDLGMILPQMTMKACGNNCVFCFVYQNPKGLRKALYFKDEDYRFSFLYGHYVTMTTLKQKDLERIVEQKLSPLFISVHSTEDATRKLLLGIKRDDHLLQKIEYLTQNGIELHTQIVLCPGINDGKVFDKTVRDLKAFYPGVRSIAVVPVGLTQHRENLMPLRMHTPQELRSMIDYTNQFRNKLQNEIGESFIYLADEFFIKAEQDLPETGYYDAFYQIENGVGEFRQMIDDFNSIITSLPRRLKYPVKITWVTGTLAVDILQEYIVNPLCEQIENLLIELVPVTNHFYGPTIEVSGLLVGQDIYRALQADKIGDLVLLPPRVLNEDGLFLDDWTVEKLSNKIAKPCYVMTDSLESLPEIINAYLHVSPV